jgi:hypothetical protein
MPSNNPRKDLAAQDKHPDKAKEPETFPKSHDEIIP